MTKRQPFPSFLYPVVVIVWEDHYSDAGWLDPKSLGGKCSGVSLGFLVNENEDCYFISTTAMGNNVCDPLAIMKSAVKMFKRLTGQSMRPTVRKPRPLKPKSPALGIVSIADLPGISQALSDSPTGIIDIHGSHENEWDVF